MGQRRRQTFPDVNLAGKGGARVAINDKGDWLSVRTRGVYLNGAWVREGEGDFLNVYRSGEVRGGRRGQGGVVVEGH